MRGNAPVRAASPGTAFSKRLRETRSVFRRRGSFHRPFAGGPGPARTSPSAPATFPRERVSRERAVAAGRRLASASAPAHD